MILKYLNKDLYINFIISIFIFSLDRLTKIYVISLSEKNFDNLILETSYLNIRLIWNEGIAFGLLSFQKEYYYNILTLIIIIIIIVIFIMILKNSGLKKYYFLMIFGGALGNLYDRVFFKAVPDFIDFHIGEFHWFIFNVADIFITLGVIFMIIDEIIDNNLKKNENI